MLSAHVRHSKVTAASNHARKVPQLQFKARDVEIELRRVRLVGYAIERRFRILHAQMSSGPTPGVRMPYPR